MTSAKSPLIRLTSHGNSSRSGSSPLYLYLKGAPDVLLQMVTAQLHADGPRSFVKDYWQERIQKQAQKASVLAAAFKEVAPDKEVLSHQTYKTSDLSRLVWHH